MRQEPGAGRRIVSRGEYVAVKSLAVCLSGGLLACGFGITLLLASLLWAYYLDSKAEAQGHYFFMSYSMLAMGTCVLFIPVLLLVALSLWLGSRKSWKTVRAMQPISYANTGYLPAPDSLVRASQEPVQAQEDVLLRGASGETQAGQEGQLLRASVGGQE